MTTSETTSETTSTGAWPAGIAAITLFVDDLDESKVFYERCFDAPVVIEDSESVAYRFGSTVINLLVVHAASELVEPASVGPSDAGARAVLTVTVDDVDAVANRLRERGVSLLSGPITRPWGPRTASFRDPSGHIWEIAQ